MVSQTENQIDADGVQEDVPEAPPSEATDLAILIKEYEGDTKAVDSKPADSVIPDTKPPESTPHADIGKVLRAVQPAVDFVKKQEAKEAKAEFNADVKEVIDFFSEADELKDLPDKLKRGFLEVHAQETPEFKTAFENKTKDPTAWGKAMESARDAFTELASELPSSKVRSDVEAALAAVDGKTEQPASDDGPSPVKKMNMSDYEWRQYTEEQERLAEAS